MISAKKLIKLARRWQKWLQSGEKESHYQEPPWMLKQTVATHHWRSKGSLCCIQCGSEALCATFGISKEQNCDDFVVYSVDQKRFVLPLEYLKNKFVMELFNLAEEEFGLPGDGVLTMPCDANFMEYVIALIKRKPSKEVEKALTLSVATGHFSSSYLYQQETSQQFPIYSF